MVSQYHSPCLNGYIQYDSPHQMASVHSLSPLWFCRRRGGRHPRSPQSVLACTSTCSPAHWMRLAVECHWHRCGHSSRWLPEAQPGPRRKTGMESPRASGQPCPGCKRQKCKYAVWILGKSWIQFAKIISNSVLSQQFDLVLFWTTLILCN